MNTPIEIPLWVVILGATSLASWLVGIGIVLSAIWRAEDADDDQYENPYED